MSSFVYDKYRPENVSTDFSDSTFEGSSEKLIVLLSWVSLPEKRIVNSLWFSCRIPSMYGKQSMELVRKVLIAS